MAAKRSGGCYRGRDITHQKWYDMQLGTRDVRCDVLMGCVGAITQRGSGTAAWTGRGFGWSSRMLRCLLPRPPAWKHPCCSTVASLPLPHPAAQLQHVDLSSPHIAVTRAQLIPIPQAPVPP